MLHHHIRAAPHATLAHGLNGTVGMHPAVVLVALLTTLAAGGCVVEAATDRDCTLATAVSNVGSPVTDQ
mgnify:CR=1 FL=1